MTIEWPSVLRPELHEELAAIRRAAGKAVQPTLLLHYTDHSLDHLDRVAKHFVALGVLGDRGHAPLNEMEWFVGLAACYLHDVALQSSQGVVKKPVEELTERDFEQVRRAHGYQAYELIMRDVKGVGSDNGTSRPPSLGVRDGTTAKELAEVIALLCKYHTGPIDPVLKLTDKKTPEGLVRVRLIAHLLRIADGIDLDHRRVDMNQLTRFEINTESQFHWWRHHYVDSVEISKRGRIRVSMTFPESTHSLYMEAFARSVAGYIKKELSPAEDYLIDQGFNLHLPDPSCTTEYGNTKEGLPKSLARFMEKHDAKLAVPNQPAELNFQPKSKRAEHYQSAWNIVGNPWNLIPVALHEDEFVVTGRINELLGEIEFLRNGRTGELRLLYGRRGGGKTSFLRSVLDQYDPENTIMIDVVRASGDVPSEFQLYEWVFKEVHTKLTGRAAPAKVGSQEIETALADSEIARPVILLDNLDRFMEDPEPDVLRRFFGLAQGNLETLKRRAIVLISATTRWQDILDDEDFNYLGREAYMELASFTTDETRDLIDNRLRMAGSSYNQVFTKGVARRICQHAGGNPRDILLAAQKLCNAAAEELLPRINAEFAERELGKNIQLMIRRTAIDKARESSEGESALRAIYAFHVASQQATDDDEMVWALFSKLYDSESLSAGSTPAELVRSVGKIAERLPGATPNDAGKWRLHQHIRRYLRSLGHQGITPDDFGAAFSQQPINFRPKEPPVQIDKKPQVSGTAGQLIKQAIGLISAAEEISGNPVRKIIKAHFAAERIFLARAAVAGEEIPSSWLESSEGIIRHNFGASRRKPATQLIGEMINARKLALPHESDRRFRDDAYTVTNRTIVALKGGRSAEKLTEADATAVVAAVKALFESTVSSA